MLTPFAFTKFIQVTGDHPFAFGDARTPFAFTKFIQVTGDHPKGV